MNKEEILKRFSLMSEVELNEVLTIYRKHLPQKTVGEEIITIPAHIKKQLSGFGADSELSRIIDSFPTRLICVESPSKTLAEKCKQIYISACLNFDETGELFIQKVLEYAASYQTRPLIICGPPGCGKSHRAKVLAKMIGLPYERVDIPLATHGSGLSGEGGSYRNASLGIIAKGMLDTGACNYVLNGEELDKEEHIEEHASFSDQFLKVLDQDAGRFRDNRLGFDIDASHIIYVFTANDKSKISQPMLDRCDVIELNAPSQSETDNIVRGAVIPKIMNNAFRGSKITFSDEAIEFIVSSLWSVEGTSIRQYETLVSRCVSAANYSSICSEQSIVIQVSDVEKHLRRMSASSSREIRIGFV